jgi:adenylosuccinate lyase
MPSASGDRGDDQPRREGGRILAARALRGQRGGGGGAELIHFACTSEDINNLAHARMLKGGRDAVLLPAIDAIVARLERSRRRTRSWRCSRAPTASRPRRPRSARRWRTSRIGCARARGKLAKVEMLGKVNGATGNFNAHVAAAPQVDWPSSPSAS